MDDSDRFAAFQAGWEACDEAWRQFRFGEEAEPHFAEIEHAYQKAFEEGVLTRATQSKASSLASSGKGKGKDKGGQGGAKEAQALQEESQTPSAAARARTTYGITVRDNATAQAKAQGSGKRSLGQPSNVIDPDSDSGSDLGWPTAHFTNREFEHAFQGRCNYCGLVREVVAVKKEQGCVRCWRLHFNLPLKRRRR